MKLSHKNWPSTPPPALRDRPLITGGGGGGVEGATKRRGGGGQVKSFTPTKIGGGGRPNKILAILMGWWHNKFWGSFTAGA